jgi:pyruvate/2-oxoglutarate dehydrogenase complex dihydrolipoamide dehydrogenase (E3) component
VKNFNIVIIGGGAAGVAAAISASNSNPGKTVAIIKKEKITLVPCGIPYIINRLSSVEDDIMPDTGLLNLGVEFVHTEVVGRNDKVLQLANGEEVGFEKLIIAVGSIPVKPPIKGIDLEGVFIVNKDIDYLRGLREAAKKAKKVVVIGGGYVGVEFADELLADGKQVSICERLPNLLPMSMDPEFSELLEADLKLRKADLRLGCSVSEIEKHGKALKVKFADGAELETDMVLVSVGARPNVGLAQKMGLKVDEKRGILIDEYMRTSEKGIFAAGDCVVKSCCCTGESQPIMLASTACAQGRLAGANIYSIKVVRTFSGILGTFSTKIGKMAFGASGLNEKQVKDIGMDYVVGTAEVPDRHPGKFKDTSKLFVKLIYARYSHTLLGGQVKGGDSVGELVNVLAVMIQNKMTDMEVDALQIGTHPLLTSSPVVYPIIKATADAIVKWFK